MILLYFTSMTQTILIFVFEQKPTRINHNITKPASTVTVYTYAYSLHLQVYKVLIYYVIIILYYS